MKQFVLLFALAFLCLTGKSQETISLNSAIAKALENNLNIQVAENSVNIAENSATKGNSGLLPTVTAGAGYNASVTNTKLVFAAGNPDIDVKGAQSSTTSGNVTASYTLFNGFMASNTFSKLNSQTELAKAQQQVIAENVLMQVIQTYYQALQTKSNLEVAKNNLAISKERYQRATLRVEFGSANKIEMLNAEVDMQNDSISVVSLEQQLRNAKSTLAYFMGEENGQSFEVEESVEMKELISRAEIESKAQSQNATLNQARAQSAVAEQDVNLSKAYLYPRLSVNAGYSASSNQSGASFISENRSSGLNGSLNLSYNLFDGGKNKIREQNSQIALDNAMLKSDDAQRLLKTQIETAYTTYENNLAIHQLRQASVKVNQANFERSEEAYKAGQITGTAFREAQLNLANARIQENLALIQAKMAEFELMRLSGELVK